MRKSQEGERTCPVCQKYVFEEYGCFETCPVCNWGDDPLQRAEPDYKGGYNHLSLNEARLAYKKGKEIF